MSAVSSDLVRELRERSGAGIMDCKRALTSAAGDLEKAMVALREKGLAAAAKRSSRSASEGLVGSYIHAGGKIGVLVEVNCETDFVARTEDFQRLAKDLAMQVAAAQPRYVRREDVPEDVVRAERGIYEKQAASSGKPEKVIEKIVNGKMEKFFGDVCLLEQTYIKDSNKTVGELITETAARVGENVVVRRFACFVLGEQSSSDD